MKKLLTLGDLYSYYVNLGKNITFNAENENTQIVVQVPARLIFKSNDKDTEGLLPVHLQANHTDTNRNGSHIEDYVAEKALPSFCNRPILGYIHDVNGQWEFYGHNMHEDDDGNVEYDEKVIGIIPESCGAKLIYDKEKKKTYVEVDGYIYEEYSHAAEILQREKECDVSVELAIRELAYNAAEKYLDIKDYFYSGVTILGCDEEGKKINPGMEGSNIKLTDFSIENNSLVNNIDEKLDNFFNRISNLLNNIGETQKQSTKGGKSQVNKFEELLKKYNKTLEDIKFEYEGLSDEELEAAFAEAFEESEDDKEVENNVEDNELKENEACGGSTKKKKKCSEDGAEENQNELDSDIQSNEEEIETEDEDNIKEDEACGSTKKKKKCSEDNSEETIEFTVKKNDDIKTFSVSLKDKFNAIYSLVQSTYGEADNEYYDVDVFEDNKTVEMYGMFYGKNYRQSYKVKNDTYSLVGDRAEIFAKYMTQDEINAFENMKSNYASLEQYKLDNEASLLHSEKEKVVSSDKYSIISSKNEEGEFINESYKQLYSEMDNYSIEELEEKLKAIVGECALNGSINFSSIIDTEKKASKVILPLPKTKKPSRYGNLFDGIINK